MFRVLLCCACVYINCGAAAGLVIQDTQGFEFTRLELNIEVGQKNDAKFSQQQEKQRISPQKELENNNGFTRALPSDV